MKAVILAEGKLGVFTSKTATCIIMYRAEDVVAVIDSTRAGTVVQEHLNVGGDIPVLSSIAETVEMNPDTLIIGIAPPGGGLPNEFRRHILEAIDAGLDVISGLHVFLNDDKEISEMAAKAGVKLTDLRKMPTDLTIGQNLARDTKCLRVLTTGTDCNVGKMVAAWEIAAELKKRGRDSKFVATGQTGMILSGDGMAVDRVISDFVSGAAEKLVLDNAFREVLVIEGQGTLQHPSYSGVTLSLIHGTTPQALVLVHHASRKFLNNYDIPILGLPEQVRLYENIAGIVNRAKVVGIALNCADMDEKSARAAAETAAEETGLPVTDVIKFGPGPLADALEEML